MSDSSFGGDTALSGSDGQIPQDQSGNKSGGGFPFGGGSGNQNNLLNALNMDPSSMAGGYGDPLYQAQLATQPANAPVDPQTGAATSPGAGQPSGQSGGFLSQLVNALNPFSMSGAQARPQQPAAPGQPPAAPSWMRPDPKDMFTQEGDPSASGSPAYAGMVPGTPPPTPRQNAPAAAPVPAQAPSVPLPRPRPAAADAAPAAADTPPAADPYYDPGGAFGLGPERAAGGGTPGATYDPSTDPFAAATGMTAPAGGGTGDLPIPAEPPGTFADKILGPSRAQAALPPKDQSQAPDVGDPLTTPTTDPSAVVPMESGTSGATQGTGAPSQAPAQPSGDTATPPAAAPTAGAGPSGGGQAGQPQINPMRLLTDLLFGGPQRLMQDLQSMMQQSQMPGYGQQGGQQANGQQQGGRAAPWLAQGQRAPRGTRPQDYPQATPEQVRAIQQRQAVPGIDQQGRPQARDAQQPNQPRPVTTQRVAPSSGSPNLPGATTTAPTMPSTGSGNLDPFTQAAAGGPRPPGAPGATGRPAPSPPAPNSPAAQNPATQIPRPDLTANMPKATPTNNAPAAHPGFGPTAIPANRTRPGHYGGLLTVNGQQFRYGTGGGVHGSLPYGTYYLHPRGVGPIGRGIGAWAGISDSNNSGDNTVSRDPKTGVARRGVEIHPSSSGYTDGCIGIMDHRGFRNALNQASRNASLPLILEVRPDGSASISPMSTQASSTQASGRQGLMQGASSWSPPANPAEQLASAAYDRMPPRYGSRRNRREWENFRRSTDVEDRRRESPDTATARDVTESWRPERDPTQVSGPRAAFATGDPNDPMSQALGMGNLWRRAPRRTARQ